MDFKNRTWIAAENIEESNNDEQFLVNSNQIYWLLSEVSRHECDNKETIIKTLKNVLEQLNESRALYVSMDSLQIKECFGSNLKSMPFRTFALHDKLGVVQKRI